MTDIAAKQTAAATQQATIQVARDTLAATGDVGPRWCRRNIFV